MYVKKLKFTVKVKKKNYSIEINFDFVKMVTLLTKPLL